MSVGLAGVWAAGRRGHQGSGGVRLEGAARAGDRAGGPLLIGQAGTAQAGQIGQAVTVGGAVLPGADRGGGGADRGGQRAEEKPGRAAQAVHSGFFVSAADRGGGGSFPVPIGAGAVWHWFRLHLIHPHRAPGTGPAGTVPPGQLCRLPEGSDSSLNGISPHR